MKTDGGTWKAVAAAFVVALALFLISSDKACAEVTTVTTEVLQP